MSGVQLAFGIALTLIGLGVLPVSSRVGRHMDAERDRLREGAPKINSVVVAQGVGNSVQKLPILCGVLAVVGTVLMITAFTAH